MVFDSIYMILICVLLVVSQWWRLSNKWIWNIYVPLSNTLYRRYLQFFGIVYIVYYISYNNVFSWVAPLPSISHLVVYCLVS